MRKPSNDRLSQWLLANSPTTLLLWNELVAYHRKHHGRVYPSVGRLASALKKSERTVQYHLRRLESLGVLRVKHVGGLRTRAYYLTPELFDPSKAPGRLDNIAPKEGAVACTPGVEAKGASNCTRSDPGSFDHQQPNNTTPRVQQLCDLLVRHGVVASRSAELVEALLGKLGDITAVEDRVRRQIGFLPARKNIQNPGGYLISAIENDFPGPENHDKNLVPTEAVVLSRRLERTFQQLPRGKMLCFCPDASGKRFPVEAVYAEKAIVSCRKDNAVLNVKVENYLGEHHWVCLEEKVLL